jgi:hypothetical protein
MKTDDIPQQLTLLPSPGPARGDVPAQFRIDEATRRRGLQHIAEIRARLSARNVTRDAA